jgi:hypothetical protein
MAVTIGADGRPYTDGKLIGEDLQGNPLVMDKQFLIDSGARISAIDEDNARLFRKSRLSMVVASGVGGEGLDVYECVTMQFSRTTADGSGEEEVTCHLPFAVVRRPYCILGVDQLSATKTDFTFSPAKSVGELKADP